MNSTSFSPILLANAQWHYKQGHHLILLHPQDKRPVYKGFKKASRSELVSHIKDGGNVGWLIGNDHLVIDVDVSNGKPGIESFKVLNDTFKVPNTRVIATGSGGEHHYYFIPSGFGELNTLKQNHALYPGIDFLTGRHYVLIAGCTHPNGKPYSEATPHNTAVATLPLDGLLAELERTTYTRSQKAEYDEWELRCLLEPTPNDDVDYDDWIAIGMALQFELGEEGFDLWDEWSAKSGKYDPIDLRYRWESFGQRDGGPMRTGGTIAQLCRKWNKIGQQFTSANETAEWRPVTDNVVQLAIVPTPPFNKLPIQHFLDAVRADSSGRDALPVLWNVEGWFQRGQHGLIAAEGGAGKTTFTMHLAIDIALGRPWMGKYATRQGSTYLISLEDSQDDLNETLVALMFARKLTLDERIVVVANVRLVSMAGVSDSELFSTEDGGKTLNPTNFAQHLLAQFDTEPDLRLVVIDTARQFAGVEMNADIGGVKMNRWLAQAGQTAGMPNALVVTHTSKAVARAKVEDQYAALGAGSWSDNARIAIRLRRIDTAERGKLVLPPGQVLPMVIDSDGNDTVDIIRVVSTRGSLRVKAPAPFHYTRDGFELIRLDARQATPEEQDMVILETIRQHLQGVEITKTELAAKLPLRKAAALAAITAFIDTGELGLVSGKVRGKDVKFVVDGDMV